MIVKKVRKMLTEVKIFHLNDSANILYLMYKWKILTFDDTWH